MGCYVQQNIHTSCTHYLPLGQPLDFGHAGQYEIILCFYSTIQVNVKDNKHTIKAFLNTWQVLLKCIVNTTIIQ